MALQVFINEFIEGITTIAGQGVGITIQQLIAVDGIPYVYPKSIA
jgi:hypothetical protein